MVNSCTTTSKLHRISEPDHVPSFRTACHAFAWAHSLRQRLEPGQTRTSSNTSTMHKNKGLPELPHLQWPDLALSTHPLRQRGEPWHINQRLVVPPNYAFLRFHHHRVGHVDHVPTHKPPQCHQPRVKLLCEYHLQARVKGLGGRENKTYPAS